MPKAKMEAISLRRCSALIRSGGVWLVVFIGKGSFLTNCVNSKLSKRPAKRPPGSYGLVREAAEFYRKTSKKNCLNRLLRNACKENVRSL